MGHRAENPARLAEAGVKIAFTAHGLKDAGGFLAAVRKAVDRGLKPAAALRALTMSPAEIFGISDRLGTLEPGKAANLIIASGDLFAPKTKILESWIDGHRYEVEAEPLVDVRGTWNVELTKPDGAKETLALEITGQAAKLSGKIKHGDKSSAAREPGIG